MTGYVKINLPTNDTEPEPQWLNQSRVTLAMGKRYEQKCDVEKARDCYETVLHLDPGDTGTRVRLSRCYQRTLRLGRAVDQQVRAARDDPDAFHVAVNEADIKCELGDFENSLLDHVRCFKRWKLSPDCNRGLLKIKQIMENTLPSNGIAKCLEATILKMAVDETYFHSSTIPSTAINKTTKLNPFREARVERIQFANYLRYVIENVEFYEEELEDLPKFNIRDKLIYEQMQEVVHTFKKVKDDLYNKNPFYLFPCQRPKRRRLDDRQKVVKDEIKRQVCKYIDAVVEHCLTGEIRSAQRQAELAMDFMNKNHYKPLRVVNTLYETLGLAVYLVNQDMPKWSKELNEKRMLFILGSSSVRDDDSYRHVLRQSYFGSSDVYNTSDALKKLTRQLMKTEPSMYSLHLQHERIKCHFTRKDFNGIRPLARQMFIDAFKLGSIAWQVNALMTSLLAESRLGNIQLCVKNLEFIIPLCRILGNNNVTEFMRKIWKLFAENKVKVNAMGPEEMRRADLVDIMPDSNAASYMRKLLKDIVKLPKP